MGFAESLDQFYYHRLLSFAQHENNKQLRNDPFSVEVQANSLIQPRFINNFTFKNNFNKEFIDVIKIN